MSYMDLLIAQLPEPFNFYRSVLESDHLHFGVWPEDRPDLTLEEAQEVMFNSLLDYFPDPPASVLDVGCGLGLSGCYLEEKGYHVTAIAPSRELIDYASRKYGGRDIDFQVADFLDNGGSAFTRKKYGIILFQESLQYLNPLDMVFNKVRSLLEPGGAVIIGDEICYDKSIRKETAAHLLKDITTALCENGFRITADKAIGNSVIKTCDNVISRFTDHFDQIVSSVEVEDVANRLKFFLNGWKKQKEWYLTNRMGYHIMAAAKDDIFMRSYNRGDEDNILQLFNQIFQKDRTNEHWCWKFKDNPFGNLKIAEAVTKEGDLTGQYCGYPVPFYSSVGEFKEFSSFQIGDTMTSLKARRSGFGKTGVLSRVTTYFYNKFCIDNVPFIYGFNTGKIRKLGERYLQYEYTSTVPYHVIDLRQKKIRAQSVVKRLLSGFAVEQVSEMTDEYDIFFERVCDDYGMLVKKTSLYLKWRYLDCPDTVHKMFAVRRFGKLVGWSVFSAIDGLLLWGDALFEKKYPAAVGFMLNYLVRHLFKGITRIEGWFAPVPVWWTQILQDMGFEAVDEPNALAPTFKIFDSQFSTDFFESNFYYTMGDSDLF
ncbi:MAG: GNAT family N-acetyltransferase [Deltaproteobacteria bacterium]|nr:GNAT family N-acetyltransferase [Deltaproteobacteria bacterium]